MMTYIDPSSDEERLAFLRLASAATHDGLAGRDSLSPGTRAQLSELIDAFAAARAASHRATERYRKRWRVADRAVSRLRHKLQVALEAVRHQAPGARQEGCLLAHYQLTRVGEAPNPTTRADWVALGAAVLQSDEAALAAGYPGLPDRSSLEMAHQYASNTLNALGDAFAEKRRARRRLRYTRRQVNILYRSIAAELRHHLCELGPEARRDVMRGYGLCFAGDEMLHTPAWGETESDSGRAAVQTRAARPDGSATGSTPRKPVMSFLCACS